MDWCGFDSTHCMHNSNHAQLDSAELKIAQINYEWIQMVRACTHSVLSITHKLALVRLKLHLWQIDVRLFIQIDKRQSTRIRKKDREKSAQNSMHLFLVVSNKAFYSTFFFFKWFNEKFIWFASMSIWTNNDKTELSILPSRASVCFCRFIQMKWIFILANSKFGLFFFVFNVSFTSVFQTPFRKQTHNYSQWKRVLSN